MADDTERLSILLEARVNQLEKDMAKASKITGDSFNKMRRASKDASDRMVKDFEGAGGKIGKAFSGLANLKIDRGGIGGLDQLFAGISPKMAAAGAGFTIAAAAAVKFIQESAQAGDKWNQLGNTLKSAGIASRDLANEQQRVADMAIRSHASLEATGNLYKTMIGVSRTLGQSNQKAAVATETVAKALSLAGVSSESAKGAIVQLSQALGSGTLRGDEFNSIMEALGTQSPLIRSIADQFGVTANKLRDLAQAGQLTSEKVFAGIIAAQPEIDAMAKSNVPSLAQAWTDLDTATTNWFGTVTGGETLAKNLAQTMDNLAISINNVAAGYERASEARAKQVDQYAIAQTEVLRQGIAEAQKAIDEARKSGWSEADLEPAKQALEILKEQLRAQEKITDAKKEEIQVQQNLNDLAAEMQRETTRGREMSRDRNPADPGQTILDKRNDQLNLTDRERKIAEATDKIIEAMKKAGTKLDGVQLYDAARSQATKEYDAGIGADGVTTVLKSYVDRVIRAESGGKGNAANPNSSAVGFGQFIASTWVDQFKKVFPQQAATMSKEGILALRSDMGINRALIENYAKENADALQKAGVAVNEAALQLSHFLGVGDAIKVLKAAPGTPLAGLISSASIRANPTILGGGRTVDDAMLYAQGRANDTRVAAGDLNPEERRAKSIKDLIEAQRQETVEVERSTSTLSRNSYEQAFSAKQADLLAKAKRENLEITPQLRAAIDQEAAAYARATTAQKSQEQSLKQTAEAKQWLGQELTSTFAGIVTGSMSAADAVKRLADAFVEAAIQAALLGKGPLAGLFGGGGGLLSGIFGFSSGGMASAEMFADGGHVRGPGTGTSDSIPAMISNGEYIINAKQTAKYLPLLEAINSGHPLRFASGGFVGGNAQRGAGLMLAGSAMPAININTTVHAAPGGDPKQNQDAADRTAKAVEAQVRQIVSSELAQQMRPGNSLWRAARGR